MTKLILDGSYYTEPTSSAVFIILLLLCQLVLQVGPSYGRRTLSGLLRSDGIVVGEQRVRRAMANVTPGYVEHRQQHTHRLLNPVPYYAQYHGHKLHLDQIK